MAASAFQEYISKIEADYKGGMATELTYRSMLEALLEGLDLFYKE